MKLISVLTPTYNRTDYLKVCYNSLLSQTNKNFEWVIVDDGSIDNTDKVVNEFIKDNKLMIRYFKKENGGKHTALNLGFEKIDSVLTVILDSDDIFTNDAIETINLCYDKYKDQKHICGFSFLRKYSNNNVIGEEYPVNEQISSFIEMRINKNIPGDKCEVLYTNILKDYRFPIFKGERFLAESTMWIELTKNYKFVFVNDPIYITEYLAGGLSKQGKKLRVNCPNGGMYNSNLYTIKGIRLSYRIKKVLLYGAYSFFAKVSYRQAYKKSHSKGLFISFYPLSFMIYLYWKRKYKGE